MHKQAMADSIQASTSTSTTSTTLLPSTVKQPTHGKLLPVKKGVTLAWCDVSIYALTKEQAFFKKTKTSYKRIINNVSGAVKPGSLTAIMGASGSGKTTLMSALAFRNPTGMITEGDIRVNGKPIGPHIKRFSMYLDQDELFVGVLTAREHLNFYARLRLDRRISAADRSRRVNELLSDVGLTKNADTQIGNAGQGKKLSGGEKKRLSFATEMLTEPDLLFCDEPTTGLDSYAAQQLVRMMKTMAAKGKTVLCTIHQPSSEIFDMFHQVVLMADGRVAFFGNKEAALEFFASEGHKCPPTHNAAEFFIRTLAILPGKEQSCRMTVRKICDRFVASEAFSDVNGVLQLEMYGESSSEEERDTNYTEIKSLPWHNVLVMLIYRTVLQTMRDPAVQYTRIGRKMILMVIIGGCFLDNNFTTQGGIQSVQGALFTLIAENLFSPLTADVSLFSRGRALFMREYRSGLYSAQIYYFSQIIAVLPGLLIEPVLSVLIGYWLMGLRRTLYAYAMTTFIVVLVLNVAATCGILIFNIVGTVQFATIVGVVCGQMLAITSGLLINLSTLPFYFSWTQYISFFMYGLESVSIVQWVPQHNITCEFRNPDQPCLTDGSQVLEMYTFSPDDLQKDIWTLVIMYVLFHLLSFVFFLRRANK